MLKEGFGAIIKDFFEYYSIRLIDLKFEHDVVPVVHFLDGNDIAKGVRNLISKVQKPESNEEYAVQDEWAEYIQTHGGTIDSSESMKELNEYLSDKVYFVGNQIGPIDIFIYYLLYDAFKNLSFQEKEKYINTSRWFNYIQRNENVRAWRALLPFTRCLLYGPLDVLGNATQFHMHNTQKQ